MRLPWLVLVTTVWWASVNARPQVDLSAFAGSEDKPITEVLDHLSNITGLPISALASTAATFITKAVSPSTITTTTTTATTKTQQDETNSHRYKNLHGFRTGHRRPEHTPSFYPSYYKGIVTNGEPSYKTFLSQPHNMKHAMRLLPILGKNATQKLIRQMNATNATFQEDSRIRFPDSIQNQQQKKDEVNAKKIKIDESKYSIIDDTSKVLNEIKNIINDNIQRSSPKPIKLDFPEELYPEQIHLLQHIMASSDLDNLREGRSISANDNSLNILRKQNISKLLLPLNKNGKGDNGNAEVIKALLSQNNGENLPPFRDIKALFTEEGSPLRFIKNPDFNDPEVTKMLSSIAADSNIAPSTIARALTSKGPDGNANGVAELLKSNPSLVSSLQKQLRNPVPRQARQEVPSIGKILGPTIQTAAGVIQNMSKKVISSGQMVGSEAAYLAQDAARSILKGIEQTGETAMQVATDGYFAALRTHDRLGKAVTEVVEDFGKFLGSAVGTTIGRAVEAATKFGKFLHDMQVNAMDGLIEKGNAAKTLVADSMDVVGKAVEDTADIIGKVTVDAIQSITGYDNPAQRSIIISKKST